MALTDVNGVLAGQLTPTVRRPVGQLSKTDWGQATAADLRRFLVQQIESHADRKLVTARLLEESEG